MTRPTAHQQDLLQTALAVVRSGVSLVPVSATQKKPIEALLPLDPNSGIGSWREFQQRLPTEQEITYWIASNAQIAVVGGAVSGGLLIIDFDDQAKYHDWLKLVGSAVQGLPIQRTGGGGYQVFFRCPSPGKNDKLAWIPDDTKYDGRSIAIETRGEGGYAIIAPSLHPSGNYYTLLQHDFTQIPTLDQASANALLNAAKSLDEVPFTKQQLASMQQAMQQPNNRVSANGSANVIDLFNQAYDLEDILQQCGYSHCYHDRWSPPNAPTRRDSVFTQNGKAYHHDTDYPLSDGYWHNAFDIWCYYQYQGDVKQAVKAAATLLCLPPINSQPLPHPAPSQPTPSPTPQPQATQAFHPMLISAPLTDLGNAECLAALRGDQLRYCRNGTGWLVWSGHHWESDRDAEARQAWWFTMRERQHAASLIPDPKQATATFEWAKKRGESDQGTKAGLNVAQSLPIFNTSITQYDQNEWLLGVRNGVIDLQTQTFRAGHQDDMLTMQANINYDPAATCSTWRQFLVDIFDNDTELIKYIQRVVGYCLTGSTKEQKMFLLFGGGANGKSTFISTLSHMLGDYAKEAHSHVLDANRATDQTNDLAMLRSVRFVTIIETDADKRLDEPRVKHLTGGDMITCRFLRREFFSYRPNFKIMMATNYLPAIRNMDRGIWRRLEAIPFEQNFENRMDKSLEHRLPAEASGILNWALEGLRDWLAHGLGSCEAVEKAKKAYRGVSDVVGQFLEEKYILTDDDNDDLPAKAFYYEFEQWAKARGERAMTANSFGRILDSKGFRSRRKIVNAAKVTVYLGLRERTTLDP